MFTKSHEIIQPNPNELVVVNSLLYSAISIIFYMGAIIAWYWILLHQAEHEDLDVVGRIQELVADKPYMWLFVLAPLGTIVPAILRSVKVFIWDEKFRFDGTRNLVSKNSRPLAAFDGIEKISIKTYEKINKFSSRFGFDIE